MSNDLCPALILASGSPRRRDLLNEARFEFEVIPPTVEEIDDPSKSIEDLTEINARLKADSIADVKPDAVVLAADTLVLRDGRALGKPADMDEAATMIRSLNGRSHQVFTAVCIVKKSANEIREFTVVTDVHFKNLTDDELNRYHSLIDPLDKAGAYAAQDFGEIIIETIEGSRTNVIGLPMDETLAALSDLQISPVSR